MIWYKVNNIGKARRNPEILVNVPECLGSIFCEEVPRGTLFDMWKIKMILRDTIDKVVVISSAFLGSGPGFPVVRNAPGVRMH